MPQPSCFFIFILLAKSLGHALGGDLTIVEDDSPVATRYSLNRTEAGTSDRVIWSKQVEKVDGERPNSWCRLDKWDENERGIIVVIEFSQSQMGILQFDAQANLISEIDVTNGDWNRAAGGDGSFKLKAPDEITLKTLVGNVSKFFVRDGELIGEDGAMVDRTGLASWTEEPSRPLKRKPILNAEGTPQEVRNSDHTKSSILTSKTTGQDSLKWWLYAVVLILAASAAAFFMLKWQK